MSQARGIMASKAARPTSAATRIGRLVWRSTSSPAATPTTSDGRVLIAASTPICAGVALSEMAAVRGSARYVTCSPMAGRVCASHKRRKPSWADRRCMGQASQVLLARLRRLREVASLPVTLRRAVHNAVRP